jgi:hypothetical protein
MGSLKSMIPLKKGVCLIKKSSTHFHRGLDHAFVIQQEARLHSMDLCCCVSLSCCCVPNVSSYFGCWRFKGVFERSIEGMLGDVLLQLENKTHFHGGLKSFHL